MNESKATAGLRGANWDSSRLPSDLHTGVHTLRTTDDASTTGLLFRRNNEKTAVCLMHPREMLASNYLIPDLLEARVAVWNQGPRAVGNDLRLEHEIALFDVAAGMSFLRGQGFQKIYMLGLSGGAALYALYNQQALLAPADRLERTPAGRPTTLSTLEMPVADGFILVSPHPGQGKLLMNCIDPSAIDESEPMKSEASLDPFSQVNGFRRPPSSSSYKAEFVELYRAAQIRRVARIDASARDAVAVRQQARQRLKASPGINDKLAASHAPIFNVWRTDADLRSWDTSIDPSDRTVGSLWGMDPAASNFGSVGFGRVCTPESWLSTWSGLSSRASFELCGPSIEQPALMIEYTADNAVFPADAQAIFDSLHTSDKYKIPVKGNHHGLPVSKGDPLGQRMTGQLIKDWLGPRAAGQR